MTVVVTSILRTVRVRALMAGGMCGLLVVGGAGYAVVASGQDAKAELAPAKAEIAEWRWAPRDELPFAAAPAEEQEKEQQQAAEKHKPKPARKHPAKAEPEVDPFEAQVHA